MADRKSIADLIDYVGARDPHRLDAMEGATADAIQILEDAAEAVTGLAFPFCETYLEFLRRMGRQPAINFGYDARTDVSSLTAAYRRLKYEPAAVVPGTLLIGAYGRTVEEVLLEVGVDQQGALRTGRMLTCAGEQRQLSAETFEGFLFRRAFEEVAGVHLPIAGLFSGQSAEPCLAEVRALAEDIGLELQWWSDGLACGAEAPRADAVLYAEQPPGEPAWLRIEARSRRMVVALGEVIRPAAAARFERFMERNGGLQARIGTVLATGSRSR